MKSLFVIILCLATSKCFSQNNVVMVEEKSSDWIKVVSTVTTSRPAKKKPNSGKPALPKKDEFDKTNNQVNRFKKEKKG